MAAIESKRSSLRMQPATRNRSKSKKPGKLPASLRYTEAKRGKTTIRRYDGRRFHRFEEAKGKSLDYIEFFTAGGYHSLDIVFEDKTSVHFVIEPVFTLDAEYSDSKTGNLRSIKKWPLMRSASFNS
jgi:hypothetical protein